MIHLVKCNECEGEFETKNRGKKFCSKKCSDKNLSEKRKQQRLKNNPPREIECENCSKKFITNRKNARACSRKCISDLENAKLSEIRRLKNEEKYKDIPDIPICKICGWKSRSIQQHVVQFHNISLDEYKQQYNVINEDIFHSSYIEFFSDRIKGEKNPAYNHGGRLSPFSKDFIKYDELSEKEKELKINNIVKQVNKSKDERVTKS